MHGGEAARIKGKFDAGSLATENCRYSMCQGPSATQLKNFLIGLEFLVYDFEFNLGNPNTPSIVVNTPQWNARTPSVEICKSTLWHGCPVHGINCSERLTERLAVSAALH